MAVGFSNTNKPINPRGQDASPLAYNRAKLYSGKALDFDGVNDEVNCGDINVAFSEISFAFHFNADSFSNNCIFQKESVFRFIGVNTNQIDIVLATTGNSWYSKKMTLTNLESKDYFLVATYNGSELKAYLNGVLVDTLGGYSGSVASVSQNVYVGRTNGGLYYNGKVSGARIFNTALTAAQVADLYNNPEKIVPTGVADSALKLWLPMMEGAGTKCLDGASLHTATERVENGDFSEGTTGWVGNPETTLSVTNGQLDIQSINAQSQYGAAFSEVNFTSGKYYLIQLDVISCDVPTQIRIGGTASAVNYATNIWNSGEIGVGTHSILWLAPSDYTYLSIGGRNDVTTLVIDNVSVKEVSVGNISGATWTHGVGSPVAQTSVIDWNKRILDKTNEFLIPQGLTAGRDLLGNLFENVRKQGALNLDGNSWAEVHDNASLDITDAITLEAWVYWDDSSGKGILGRYMTLTDERSYLLYKANANVFGIFVSSDGTGGNSDFRYNDTNLSEGWNHLVGVYDGSNLKLYLNGSIDGSKSTAIASLYANDEPIEIGRYKKSLTESYQDQIAQPRIYNRALTAEEVLRNYNSGKNTYK